MAEELLIDRLKRLQDKLLEIYAETVKLRENAERQIRELKLNEWPEFGHISRRSIPEPDPLKS